MALIKCPDCGKDISDKAEKCVHCGKVVTPKGVLQKRFCSDCGNEVSLNAAQCPFCGYPLYTEDEKIENNHIDNKKSTNIKKVLIPLSIIAVLCLLIVLLGGFWGSYLNEDERLAYQNAVRMRDMLRDPDSFRLYDDMFLIKRYDEVGDLLYTYTIFEYGGSNGYGAIMTDEAIFKDGEYIMDYADEPDEDDPNYVEQLMVQIDLNACLLLGDEIEWEKVDINIEKIKKKMGLN